MGKVKVLFLAANPVKRNPLALDEEIRAINEKIRSAEYQICMNAVSIKF
jgi:hypothetical protein